MSVCRDFLRETCIKEVCEKKWEFGLCLDDVEKEVSRVWDCVRKAVLSKAENEPKGWNPCVNDL